MTKTQHNNKQNIFLYWYTSKVDLKKRPNMVLRDKAAASPMLYLRHPAKVSSPRGTWATCSTPSHATPRWLSSRRPILASDRNSSRVERPFAQIDSVAFFWNNELHKNKNERFSERFRSRFDLHLECKKRRLSSKHSWSREKHFIARVNRHEQTRKQFIR